jgi:hypothetical protein
VKPTQKITATGIGGAVAVVACWGFGLAGVDPPSTVAAALTTICAFAAGYWVKDN